MVLRGIVTTVTDGLVLRTLADHRAFTLRAFCQAWDRSVELGRLCDEKVSCARRPRVYKGAIWGKARS